MAASGLAVELESAGPEHPNDFFIPESCQAAHSRSDHDRVVPPVAGRRQVRNPVALAPSFDQFPGDIARDIERLGNCPPLRHEAGKLIRSRKEQAFRQFLDLYSNRQFYTIDPTIRRAAPVRGRKTSRKVGRPAPTQEEPDEGVRPTLDWGYAALWGHLLRCPERRRLPTAAQDGILPHYGM